MFQHYGNAYSMIDEYRRRARVLCFVVLLPLALFGCGGAQVASGVAKLNQQWGAENSRVQLALGEKTFQAGKLDIIKAAVTGLADRNVSVLNLDRETGYVLAEGRGIVSGEREKAIFESGAKPAFERETGIPWRYVPGNYTIRINLNIFERGKESLVKMRLSSSVSSNSNVPTAHNLYPDLMREHFRILWEAIDRNLFLQTEGS